MDNPVICIDGPSGAGKGTAAVIVAQRLGFHLLDSGALYRVSAIAAERSGISLDDQEAVAEIAAKMNIVFEVAKVGEPVKVILDGNDITSEVRREQTGKNASKVAKYQIVRDALLDCQKAFATQEGLVADGRDMGTVVFPDSPVKVFLTASAQERAERRYKQLKNKGISVSLAAVLRDIEARDEQDTNRSSAPLRPADDALVLDSTGLTIEQVVDKIVDHYHSQMNL